MLSVSEGSRLPVGSSARRMVGLVHQRPRDGDALLLAAGEPARAGSSPCARGPPGSAACASARGSSESAAPSTSSAYPTFSSTVRFSSSLKSWKTTPMLRRRYGMPRLAEAADVLSADEDLPAGRLLRAEEQAQERALPRARRAGEPDELALVDLQGDVVQHRRVAGVGLLDVEELDHGPHTPASQIRMVQVPVEVVQVKVPGSEGAVQGSAEAGARSGERIPGCRWVATPVQGPVAVARLMLTAQPWSGRGDRDRPSVGRGGEAGAVVDRAPRSSRAERNRRRVRRPSSAVAAIGPPSPPASRSRPTLPSGRLRCSGRWCIRRRRRAGRARTGRRGFSWRPTLAARGPRKGKRGSLRRGSSR